MILRRDCICVVFPIENYVKHELHVKWCCYHAISMLREFFEHNIQRKKVVVVPYLYVRHSVVIEIAACCESLATNGTFCEEHYELTKCTRYSSNILTMRLISSMNSFVSIK